MSKNAANMAQNQRHLRPILHQKCGEFKSFEWIFCCGYDSFKVIYWQGYLILERDDLERVIHIFTAL